MSIYNITSIDTSAISKDTPFVIDTNVLFFVHFGYFVTPQNKDYDKYCAYSSFLAGLLQNGNILYTTTANLQELFHIIEKNEYEIYKKINSSTINKKQYRKINAERIYVKKQIAFILNEISKLYRIMDIEICHKCLISFIDEFDTHLYDPIDYIIVSDSIVRKNIHIISDDKDFHNDTRLNLYSV